MLEDTIAALATAVGEGAVGIIRLSGPEAVKFADNFFKSADGKKIEQTKPRFLKLGWWIDINGGQK
jgi:tRNA modification GTPase